MTEESKKIMGILNYELRIERDCLHCAKELMKRTHNPILKIKWRKYLIAHTSRVATLKFLITKIGRELERKD